MPYPIKDVDGLAGNDVTKIEPAIAASRVYV